MFQRIFIGILLGLELLALNPKDLKNSLEQAHICRFSESRKAIICPGYIGPFDRRIPGYILDEGRYVIAKN